MTNDPNLPPNTKSNSQLAVESPVSTLFRQISLDWWAVITALVFAALILVGLISIPW
jgi:hypothetical protein